MAFADITDAARLSLVYHVDSYPESCVLSMHTGLRAPADQGALLTAFSGITALIDYLMPACTTEKVTYSEWRTAGGFTGWHQDAAITYAGAFGSGAAAAHQLALVFGYRNTSDVTIALGRRRNRFYIGPPRTSVVAADGLLSSANRTTLFTNMQTLDNALTAVTPVGFAGFAVVSAAEGKVMTADQFSCGLRFDTMRSRNQHVPESPAYVAVT